MPSSWLDADSNFPAFAGGESTEKKIDAIQNYLYMLVEQLRWSMRNLDQSNMNPTAVERFSQTITQPLLARIQDGENALTRLSVAAGEVSATVADLQSGLSQTLRLAPDGVTVTNAAGSRLTIDGGQVRADTLNLTGCISFGDLSSGVQNSINGAASAASAASSAASGAYSAVEALKTGLGYTYIDGNCVISPNIRGGTVRGGKFYSLNGRGWMEVADEGMYTGLKLCQASGYPVFQIYDSDFGNFSIGSGSNVLLNYENSAVMVQGTWDFSQAVVIGL